MSHTCKARELQPGDVLDFTPLIDAYGVDVDEATRMVARDEMSIVQEVALEASREPGVKQVAVIYSDLTNLAVDADADVVVDHRDPAWDG